jgi:hypothetical protein
MDSVDGQTGQPLGVITDKVINFDEVGAAGEDEDLVSIAQTKGRWDYRSARRWE